MNRRDSSCGLLLLVSTFAALALMGGQWMGRLISGVSTADPVSLTLVAVILFSTSLVAISIPAR